MKQQEKEFLLPQATLLPQAAPQLEPAESVESDVRRKRMKKELEYLKNYHYSLEETDSCHEITIYDLWAEDSANNHEINKKSLKIFLPANYPFREPSFQLEGGQTMAVGELMDEWTPRYKLMEMIELLKKRIEQREALNTGLTNNAIYRVFQSNHSLWLVIVLSLLLRVLVGLGPYSGMGDWPNLGDFEAHRNWMSITVNKPIREWYFEESEEPWWRIDYPPVAAYLSYILGSIYRHIEPKAMELQFGYESEPLTAFMRFSVLLIDSLLLLPAIYLICREFSPARYRNPAIYLAAFAVLMMKPDQILIDHGHFQYNSLMLGLILMAFYCMLIGRRYLCCFLFTLAINAKLMSVYYSLAFFAALIGLAGRKKTFAAHKGQFILQVGLFGAIVVFTTVFLWLPWLGSMADFKGVLSAIFPVHRGLYQLKVPNFWCISDVLMKWESWLSKPFLTFLCALACLICSIPSMIALLVRSSRKILIFGFSTIAMTFFMFSYHVHEKSILVPLIMIPFTSQYIGGKLVTDIVVAGCVGMYHLLVEDGQLMQYYVLIGIYLVLATGYYSCEECFLKVYLSHTFQHPSIAFSDRGASATHHLHNQLYNNNPWTRISLYAALVGLHLGWWAIPPPQALPYLWNLLFAFYSFGLNSYFLLVGNCILVEEIMEVRRIRKKE